VGREKEQHVNEHALDYRPHLMTAIRAAREAGALLRAELHRPGGPRGEGGHAPADGEAEAIIRLALETGFPEHGVRGEELPERDRAERDPQKHCWWIDPNDGTSSFIKGWRGSAVSIALVRGNQPVLGVVYAFSAPDDEGDLFTWAEGCGPVQRNGVAVRREWPAQLGASCLVLISQAADRKSLANATLCAPARFRAVPSIAYRLALVAAGEADAGISLHSPTVWDVAAGHALLIGAGADLFDVEGQPIRYDRWDGGDVFGGAPALASELARRDWHGGLAKSSRVLHQGFDLCEPRRGCLISDPGQLRRAQGCWLGQLAGDSLGSLVEFRSASDIARSYPDGVRQLADGGTWNLLAGQPTDDSELALMLARRLVKSRAFDLEAIARAYAFWYGADPFDVGATTSRALSAAASAMRAGQPVAPAAQAAANSQSQANGALMRVSPLGIFGHRLPPEKLAELARADARLTHPHPVCQDASAVFTVAIAQAVGQGISAQETYERALAWAREASLCKEVLSCLEQAATEAPDDYASHMGWVLIALQNAFWQLLHAGNFAAGVVNTVSRGGDTDTNAAIAGALLGAVHGREAVPVAWRNRILCCRPLPGHAHHARPRPFWPVDALLLAEALLCAGLPDRLPPSPQDGAPD